MTDEEEPQYICLNYCMVDQETGYCLTCGRPPLPPPPPAADFSQKSFAGIKLSGKPVPSPANPPGDMPEE